MNSWLNAEWQAVSENNSGFESQKGMGLGEKNMGTGRFGHSRFVHSTSSATLYKDISAMILFMLFYVLFITILCINNHIEYKKK